MVFWGRRSLGLKPIMDVNKSLKMNRVHPDAQTHIEMIQQKVSNDVSLGDMIPTSEAGAGSDAIPDAFRESASDSDVELGSLKIEYDETISSKNDSATTGAAAEKRKHKLSLFSGFLYLIFQENIVKEWRLKSYIGANKNDPDYEEDDYWLQAPFIFLYLQVLTSILTTIAVLTNIDPSLPAWRGYTNFYAWVVNTGVPTTLFSILQMIFLEKRMEQFADMKLLVSIFISFPAFILIPPFLTHILPAMVLYIWIVFPIVLISIGIFVGWNKFTDVDNREKSQLFSRLLFCCGINSTRNFQAYLVDFAVEVYFRFLFIFIFQCMYNYASLAYKQTPLTPSAYVGIISYDYHLRSQSACFIEKSFVAQRVALLLSWF
jgi:hypothetical protein